MDRKLPTVEIAINQCKGCGLCIENCPTEVLGFSVSFNNLGYQYAELKKDGCTGCESCFYSCPEPGAVTVIKEKKQRSS